VSLADVTMTAGLGNGDYGAAADGDASGRKTTVASQTAIPVDASGTATHVCLAVVSSTRLKHCTTCTSQALTSGNTVTTPAYDVEFLDVTP
jgi:hypothetical protein